MFSGLVLICGVLCEHRGLGRREEAIEAAQHGQRQDDLAVFVPLVRPPEQVADAPDEVGELRVGVSEFNSDPLDVQVRDDRRKNLARQDASHNGRQMHPASAIGINKRSGALCAHGYS